jgi:hypothetical protein
MGFEIAVPFAPLGLDPNVYTGIAILVDNGIVKVGLAKVPFTPVLTGTFASDSMEFVLNAAMTTCLSTSGDANFGPVNVVAATVKWLATPSSNMDTAGITEPLIVGQLHTYAGQPVVPVVADGYVMLLEGARDHGDAWGSAFYVALKDDMTVVSGEIRSSSIEFQEPATLHITETGQWAFVFTSGFGPGQAVQLVGGPMPALATPATTFWDGTQPQLVVPDDPASGRGIRFAGNAEFGLLASPCGPLSNQSNAYRNSDGTFTCYEGTYNPAVDDTVAAANTYTKVANTYTSTASSLAVNTTKKMLTDAGVQYDPSVMFFDHWQEQQLHSAPLKPVTTINYFWQNVVQAQETPVITTS